MICEPLIAERCKRCIYCPQRPLPTTTTTTCWSGLGPGSLFHASCPLPLINLAKLELWILANPCKARDWETLLNLAKRIRPCKKHICWILLNPVFNFLQNHICKTLQNYDLRTPDCRTLQKVYILSPPPPTPPADQDLDQDPCFHASCPLPLTNPAAIQ